MVGIVNRPHTKRMILLRTTISTTLFHFDLSHGPSLFDSEDFEVLGTTAASALQSNPLTVANLELVEALSKLSTDAVCFAAMFQVTLS